MHVQPKALRDDDHNIHLATIKRQAGYQRRQARLARITLKGNHVS